jgi:hypothetical protein
MTDTNNDIVAAAEEWARALIHEETAELRRRVTELEAAAGEIVEDDDEAGE